MLDWLELHFEQFRPLPHEGLNSFTHIKPLGELALILYSLKAPACTIDSEDIRFWSDKASEKLFTMTETWGGDIDWEHVPNLVHRSPEIVSALLIFPVVSKISGSHSRWLPQVKNVFRQLQVNSGEFSVDVLFARDLAGIEKCDEASVRELLNVLKKPAEIRMQTSTLYLVTHYIFFAAEMGHRTVILSEKDYREVCAYLNHALEKALLQSNYDLLSELLMCLYQLKAGCTENQRKAVTELVSVIHRTGWIPGNHDGKMRNGDSFIQHYHACLMGLSALGSGGPINTLNKAEYE